MNEQLTTVFYTVFQGVISPLIFIVFALFFGKLALDFIHKI